MYIIFPVCNILAYDVFLIVNRETARRTFRPYIGYTPGIFHRTFPIFRCRVIYRIRIIHKHSQCFILIYITVRFPAPDQFLISFAFL